MEIPSGLFNPKFVLQARKFEIPRLRNGTKMVKGIKRFGILFCIFIAAIVIYIVFSLRGNSSSEVVYTAMEESTLPVVYTEMFGQKMNRMYGYRQDMKNSAARSSLTILPPDRALTVDITEIGVPVLGIRFEIRSLDLERLVENTALENWQEQDGQIQAVLPIQNLLNKERQYLLRLELDTEKYGTVYYYTRILWTEDETAKEMIDLAVNFSAKTFSYDQARELVTYLETNSTEDNSSFGRTTIRSSFSQLTWGRLKMQPAGEVSVTLKELDGIMGCVALSYPAVRTMDNGNPEYYEVEENFTMKWNSIRTYLMDYERYVNQITTGDRTDFSGKRILLGITNDDEVEVKKSADGQILAYRANRDLWSYDQKDRRLTKIFSFRGSDMTSIRDNHREHGVRILKVADSGDLDFLVYGYQNRGMHEGESGITGYHYDALTNGLNERFFIPDTRSFEELGADLTTLSCQSDTDMLYLYLDHAIYGIDLTSNESMVIADALEDGSFAVSPDHTRLAWQEGGKTLNAHTLHLMDLASGEKMDIQGASDREFVRSLGFVGRDLVYGLAGEDALWVKNGRAVDLPMYAVEIMNDQMQIETRYEKKGYYVAGVEVDESRIHLRRVTRLAAQNYTEAQEDTIVCNMDVGPGRLNGIGWYASQEKEKVYFVQMDSEVSSNRNIRMISPKRLSAEDSDHLDLSAISQLSKMKFYAYGSGRLLAVTTAFEEALQLAYEKMGYVTDQNQNILWDRVNRVSRSSVADVSAICSAIDRHLTEFTESRSYNDGMILLDARNCSMQQLLYFIGQGMPVIGYTEEGVYLVLTAFDQYNVTVYNPVTGESFKAGLNDSTEYFRQKGNDFICALQIPNV